MWGTRSTCRTTQSGPRTRKLHLWLLQSFPIRCVPFGMWRDSGRDTGPPLIANSLKSRLSINPVTWQGFIHMCVHVENQCKTELYMLISKRDFYFLTRRCDIQEQSRRNQYNSSEDLVSFAYSITSWPKI
jgi:hypothetical protein